MSTQTEHLGLHQWEAGDDFLRTDFNEDFAKIDAGVKAADAGVAAAKAQAAAGVAEVKGMATAVEAKLDEFIAAGSSVSGTYTMSPKTEVVVHLGFRPKLLILIVKSTKYNSIGISIGSANFCVYEDKDRNITRSSGVGCTISEDGFMIAASDVLFNGEAGALGYYFALR